MVLPLEQPVAANINEAIRRSPVNAIVLRGRYPTNPKKINPVKAMVTFDVFMVDDRGVSLRAMGTLLTVVRLPLLPVIAPLGQLVELV